MRLRPDHGAATTSLRWLLGLAMLAGTARASIAQGKPAAPDLMTASLEELMNIEITSASRKEQRAAEVAGAIYVITHDDIRRSGMTSIPELLRLVPGVQVAQINASKWAVSIRGFNGLYSNKLLVLIDGRSLYNRLFSGVLWDEQDLMLEDVDRIEIIRGPGAAVWGANAVNGVINILTRSASETKGVLARVGGGTFDGAQAAVRYGGAFGGLHYRVFSQWSDHGGSLSASHIRANDDWRAASAGFRGDWTRGADSVMFEGDATNGRTTALWLGLGSSPAANRPGGLDEASDMNGGTGLVRWTRVRPTGASLQVQAFVDGAHRDEPVGLYRRLTSDLDVQYHTAAGRRHDVVAGAGYRLMDERFAGLAGYSLTPERSHDKLFNVFAQDEIALADKRVHVTLGAKVEHDGLAGWGLQPTARIIWAVVPERQHLWAAASRALKTPALEDRGVRVDYPAVTNAGPLPILVTILGNPELRTEQFRDTEIGYRIAVATSATIAVTAFAGHYDDLRTSEPQAPSVVLRSDGLAVFAPVRFDNLLSADTRGLEAFVHWIPRGTWRVDAGYTGFHLTPHLDPGSQDPSAARYDGDAPSHQWQLHSGYSIARRIELDAALFRVGRLQSLGVTAYTRADARLEWKLASTLSLVAAGQNLFNRAHGEFTGADASLVSTQVPRTVRVQLAWRFPGP
ncbi:MAG: TonB-dependent receptor [Acidobacteriota bacterium]